MIRISVMPMVAASLTVLSLGVLLPASAAVYKWVDANGVVHYGDQPTQGASGTEKLKAAVSSGVSTNPGNAPASTSGAGREASAATNSATAATEAEVRAEECVRARERLASYRQADRLIVTQNDGSQEEMTPEARVAAIARVSQHVGALCQDG